MSSGSRTADGFNFSLNLFRRDLGLRKGASIVWNGNSSSIFAIGYLNLIQQPPVNDNEAKP